MLKACLLGRFDVRLNDQGLDIPSRPAQSLLAYLLLNPNKDLRREKLAGMFWPEANETNARGSLRHALWRIRKAINLPEGHEYLQGDELVVSFIPHPEDWLDVLHFEQHGHNDLEELTQKTDLYQGELLPGFIDEWVILERGRLQALYEQKMLRLLDELAAQGYWSEVCQQAELWISRSFTPEPAYRALMLAEAAQGNMSGVAATYQRCREDLRRELGVELSPVTRSVYQQIVERKAPTEIYAALVKLPRAAPYAFDRSHQPDPGEAPYKGLLSYDEIDAPYFFGREKVVAKLACSLSEWPVLVVVGASGSGKSSIIKAGLIPALKRTKPQVADLQLPADSAAWHIVKLTPGSHPLENLASRLLEAGHERMAVRILVTQMRQDPYALLKHLNTPNNHQPSHTLLVVDQFEEVFSLCREEADRQAFIDNLLHACGLEEDESQDTRLPAPTHLVIGLRADFYEACGQHALLRSALAHYQEYIGPMTASELRQAIERPAETGGWFFETGLVDLLLRDSLNAPGGLPLLSHALLETWKQRRGRTLTLAGYAASGGLHAALARSAESLYQKFSPWQQAVARSIFLRLTELRSGSDEAADPATRRRASRSELLSLAVSTPEQGEDVAFVLNTLIESRLVTADEKHVELAHEALIREWPTLREWLLEDRAGLALHRRITDSAQNWDASNRDPSELYRGTRLAQAREWAVTHPNELNLLERDFLVASREKEEQEAREKEAQRQRELHLERRARRFLQSLAWVLLAAALVSGGLAVWASIQRHQALVQASVGLAAQALNELEGAMPERAVLLTLEALEYYPYTPQAESALAQAVEEVRSYTTLDYAALVEKYPQASQQLACVYAFWVAKTNIIACIMSGFMFWNGETHQFIDVFPDIINQPEKYNATIKTYAPDPEGRRWAVSSDVSVTEDYRLNLEIWDIEAKETISFSPTITEAYSLDWSPGGDTILSAHHDGSIRIWQADPPLQISLLSGHAGPVRQAEFSPNGQLIASASDDATVHIWDSSTQKTIRILQHGSPVTHSTWSPNGIFLATGTTDGIVRIWEAATGKLVVILSGHTEALVAVAWSPDGIRLATGSKDGYILIWDALSGNLEMRIRGSMGEINSLAWSPDGSQMIIAAGYSGSDLRILDVRRKTLYLTGHSDWMIDAEWSPDGKYIATSSMINGWAVQPESGGSWIFDAATGDKLFPIISAMHLDWSPDSQRLVTTENRMIIWDVNTKREVMSLNGNYSWAISPAWSTNGKYILLGSAPPGGGDDYAATTFDSNTGEILTTIRHYCLFEKPVWYPRTDDPEKVNWFVSGCTYPHINKKTPAFVFDGLSGEEIFELPDPDADTYCAAWSPDGKYIATGSSKGLARIWDVETRSVIKIYAGHSSAVWAVAWSPDGKRLITGDGSGNANIWIAETGETVMTIKVPGHIWGVNWRPDGQYVSVAGTFEPPVIRRAWASTQALIDYAKECCSWRDLTAEERVQFGLPER